MHASSDQPSPATSQEQQDYLQEFLQLKVDACYIRDYRNGFNRWVTTTATVRAVAASGSIAIWAVWQRHAIIWASIVAASQLADALKDVFPFAKRRKALSAWVRQLDRLFVFAQRDWAGIAAGRCSNEQIRKQLHALRSRKQQLASKYIPEGLVRKQRLLEAAELEAVGYFGSRYNMNEAKRGGLNARSPSQ